MKGQGAANNKNDDDAQHRRHSDPVNVIHRSPHIATRRDALFLSASSLAHPLADAVAAPPPTRYHDNDVPLDWVGPYFP